MKITCRVVESEFLTREFEVDCGLGNQFISWLAQTACLKFGQVHYPKGIYVPNLLRREDNDAPHPRRRINQEFKDGDIVYITLKNRDIEQKEEEEIWYEQAFGAQQNIMRVKIGFMPEAKEHLKKGKNEIYAEVEYHMFEEMEGEFKRSDYPEKETVKLDAVDYGEGNFYFEHISLKPYGDIKATVKVAQVQKGEDKDLVLQPLPEGEKQDLTTMPQPMSLKQLRELHEIEEAEGQKREQEARLAQKRTQELKQKIRYEQEQQIAKQEANTAELKIYFEAINLGLHKLEEDFNASMSVLSIHHQELMDCFRFYSQLQKQIFTKDENKFILLQSFMHFMRIMKIAVSKEQANNATECLHQIDAVIIPFQDTMNILNGMNYAQFLESILRIAYWLKDNSAEKGNEDGFANTLESLFADAEFDIKKKAKNDEIVALMLTLADAGIFKDNFEILAAIFASKAMPNKDEVGLLEMNKSDFAQILNDAGVLIQKQDEKDDKKGKDEKKSQPAEGEEVKAEVAKFDETDVHNETKPTHSWDEDHITYVDYLECLVRVVNKYPFEDEQLKQSPIEMKFTAIVQKLEDKFKGLKQPFLQSLDQRSEKCEFDPRLVDSEPDKDKYLA